jgi:hypothetical protein
MNEIEKLRALLAEAHDRLRKARYLTPVTMSEQIGDLVGRIDAALAEPVGECARCETLRDLADKAAWAQGDAQRRMIEAQKQRDEARSEVERLRALFDLTRHQVADALGVDRGHGWTALSIEARQIQQARIKAEAERDEARAEVERLKGVLDVIRAARSLLGQLRDHVSDHACDELLSILSDEPMDADGNRYRSPSEMAYQRGAEAMREAAANVVETRKRYWIETSAAQGGCTTSDDRAEEAYFAALDIRDLPLPEEKL